MDWVALVVILRCVLAMWDLRVAKLEKWSPESIELEVGIARKGRHSKAGTHQAENQDQNQDQKEDQGSGTGCQLRQIYLF